ncbi:MAG TPA: ATPase [Candidatus Tripitaka sp. YC43]
MEDTLRTIVDFLLGFFSNPVFAQGLAEMPLPVEGTAAKATAEAGKYIAAGIAVGLAGVGTGLAQGRIGSAGVGAVTEKAGMLPIVLVLLVIPETIIILGFVIAIFILMR